jgi:hypothetical protein
MRSKFRRFERQHDCRLWDARLFKFKSNPMFRAVALNPALSIDEVNVDQAPMNATAIPSEVHQQIVIAGPIENSLRVNLAIGGRELRVLA